jgi:hypothetical protein
MGTPPPSVPPPTGPPDHSQLPPPPAAPKKKGRIERWAERQVEKGDYDKLSDQDKIVRAAREAFAAGDAFFQARFTLDAMQRQWFLPTYDDGGYGVKRRTKNDPGDILGQVEAIGWRLEHVDHVYVMTGQTNRDKFFSSGQDTGIIGDLVGIYLFRRATA